MLELAGRPGRYKKKGTVHPVLPVAVLVAYIKDIIADLHERFGTLLDWHLSTTLAIMGMLPEHIARLLGPVPRPVR